MAILKICHTFEELPSRHSIAGIFRILHKYKIVYNLSLHNYHDLIYILNLVLIIDKHSNKVLFSNEI